MTSAPANLLAARSLLLQYLNIKPGAPSTDLEPNEVGIVGDPAHIGGGHCGSDRVTRKNGVITDYTVVESPRDRAGLTLDAAALDVGEFEVRVEGKAHDLRSFSIWCVAQCKANTPDSRDIREIIYTADGTTVRRWDRLNKRSTGDSSHLWHTHFTFFRDAVKAGRDQRPLYRRYLTEIGLIKGEIDMAMDQTTKLTGDTGYPDRTVGHVFSDLENDRNWRVTKVGTGNPVAPPEAGSPEDLQLKMAQEFPQLVDSFRTLTTSDLVSEENIAAQTAALVIAAINSSSGPVTLTPADINTLADAVADRLAARMQS